MTRVDRGGASTGVRGRRFEARVPVSPRRPRLNAGEWLAVAVGVAAMGQAVKGRANSAPCAFVPLIVPAVLMIVSRAERGRAGRALGALWEGVAGYAAGGKTPWAAALVLVAWPVALLNMSNDRIETIGDTSTVVPTAVSLITEGDTDLDEFYGAGSWWRKVPESAKLDGVSYFLRRRGTHLYAAHPVGMVPLALPVVAASRLAGGKVSDPLVQLRLEKLTAAGVAGVSLGVFFLLTLHLVKPRPALTTTAVLAVASGVFSTVGQNLWQHDGIILGSLALMLLEFRRQGTLGDVAAGVICGTLPALRLTAVSFLLPFGLWVLLRSPRRALVIGGVAAAAFLPWAGYHMSVYGSPLGPSTVHMAGSNWTGSILTRLAGVLVSPGRGLLVYQPWVVLALLMALPAVRRGAGGGPKGWATVCVAAVALEVAVVAAWHCWWGGWCWGSRLLMGVVPLAGLLCARPVAVLLATAGGRAVVAGLTLLGLAVQVPAVYTDAFRWNAEHADAPEEAAWSWSDAPFLAPVTLPAGRGGAGVRVSH